MSITYETPPPRPGLSVFVKDGRLFTKGVKKPLATYGGEVNVAIGKDGTLARA